MKIKINAADFKKYVVLAGKFSQKRTTIPVLSHAILRADKNGVMLSSTDMDAWADFTLPAEVEEHGAVLIQLDMLEGFLSELGSGAELVLEKNEDKLKISVTGSDIDIEGEFDVTIPVDDYIPRPEADGFCPPITLSVDDVRNIIDRVRFAISTEETRYYLNGIYMHVNDGKLITVATDGHRLAKYSYDLPETTPPEFIDELTEQGGRIIPRLVIQSLIACLPRGSSNQPVTFAFRDMHMRIRLEEAGIEIDTKLIDGTYPDYHRVVPSYAGVFPLEVNRAKLLRFVNVAQRLTVWKKGTKKAIVLAAESTSLDAITADDESRASVHSRLEIAYKGKPFKLGLNARYCAELLRNIRSENITLFVKYDDKSDQSQIGLTNQIGKPVMARGSDDPNFETVLMPMWI